MAFVDSADLAGTGVGQGAAMVGFLQSGTGAVVRTARDKMQETVSVRDFGATGDGTTNDAAAIQLALNTGRRVFFPGPATYKCSTRLQVNVANTTLDIDAGTTLLIDGGLQSDDGTPDQTPFLNCINITADNCSVVGRNKGSSVIQNNGAAGSDANGIGFLHVGGGYVGNLTIDGDKADVTPISDDTFQSGVEVLNASGDPPHAVSNVLIEGCIIQNWVQYGVNLYGDLSSGTRVTKNEIRNIGVISDANSVGAGVVMTAGTNQISVVDNHIHDNKGAGILLSSASLATSNITLALNNIHNNGQQGIACIEQVAYYSQSGIGVSGLAIVGNHVFANGSHGVQVGTYDDVGFIEGVNITGNVVTDNGSYGIIVQTNDDLTNRIRDVNITGNTCNRNAQYGIGIGPNNVGITLVPYSNVCVGNLVGQILDLQASSPNNDAWTAPTLGGGYVSGYGSPYAQPGYMLDAGGTVHLRGTLTGTPGSDAFTLPSRLRPDVTMVFEQPGVMSINAAGQVNLATGSIWRLDGLSFRAA